ncbi:hypothetical protein GCM10023205_34760 [Yinghuangia aomiensis]|uniref:Protein kinase domain-containing protein n=1 Tax=Yinghuangia aomiensis TaxID=676205 RepID=A0ABP9HC49_9ACTN
MQASRPETPQQIGPFAVLGRLGSGGMGDVHLARSAGGRLVAVKTVRVGLADDPEFRQRFAREVAAMRRIDGIRTAAFVEADPQAETPWLATEFIAGPALGDAIGQFGPLPESGARALGVGLAEALAAIHAVGLVHRDLKPSNVLLAADGPRVIDFGIARSTEDTTGLTRTGHIVGTPGYQSPEQANGDRIGPASDVFCAGLVLAYATTGRNPFGSGDPVQLLFRIVHQPPDLAGVPEALLPLVQGCLSKDPSLRPAPAQMLRHLGPAAHPVGGAWLPGPHMGLVRDVEARTATYVARIPPPPPARRPAPAPVTPATRPPTPTRRRLLVGGGVLAVAAAGTTAFLLRDIGSTNGNSDKAAGSGTASKPTTPGQSPPPGGTSSTPNAAKNITHLPDQYQNVIKVGIDPSYPPNESLDAGGRVVGLTPDLTAAIGRQLGVQMTLVPVKFDQLLPGLQVKQFDVVISSMTDTKNRQGQADFVDYFSAGSSILVARGNPKGLRALTDLCGRTVAVLAGSAQSDMTSTAECNGRSITTVSADKADQVAEQVKAGRAVAALLDFPIAAGLVTGGSDFEIVGQQIDPAPYGIAVRKEDSQLRDAVKQALQSLIADGEYKRILDAKGLGAGAFQTVTVNAGT